MTQTTSPKRSVIPSLAIVLAVLCLLPVVLDADDPGFLVVVHADNPTSSLSREVLRKIFLKKIRKWNGGAPTVPMDLSWDQPAREAFTNAIHRKSPLAVFSYWERMIFSGRAQPPPVAATVEEVFAHIRKNPGGIGYMPADTVLPDWVKVLKVTKVLEVTED